MTSAALRIGILVVLVALALAVVLFVVSVMNAPIDPPSYNTTPSLQ